MEALNGLATILALVMLCAFGIASVYKTAIHLLPIAASPIYAAFIAIELLASGFGQRSSPKLARFSRPKSERMRLLLDAAAISGVGGGFAILSSLVDVVSTETTLMEFASWEWLPPLYAWLLALPSSIVFVGSQLSEPDRRDPIIKLRALLVPKALAERLGSDA